MNFFFLFTIMASIWNRYFPGALSKKLHPLFRETESWILGKSQPSVLNIKANSGSHQLLDLRWEQLDKSGLTRRRSAPCWPRASRAAQAVVVLPAPKQNLRVPCLWEEHPGLRPGISSVLHPGNPSRTMLLGWGQGRLFGELIQWDEGGRRKGESWITPVFIWAIPKPNTCRLPQLNVGRRMAKGGRLFWKRPRSSSFNLSKASWAAVLSRSPSVV